MDETRRELLRQSHMTIVNDLEPRGNVLNTLYEDGILTENDLESIITASTRKERCLRLLLLLPTRGPAAYGSFQRALQSGSYDNLSSSLRLLNDQLDNDYNTQTKDTETVPVTKQGPDVCVKCDRFLGTLTELSSSCSNAQFGHLLFKHCCLFLDNVEALDLVDQLFQDHVLSADDIERIKSGVSRRDRCVFLVTELLKSSNSVESSLKTALSKKYGYIVDKLFPVHPTPTEITNDVSNERMKDKIQVLQKLRTMGSDCEQKTDPNGQSADFKNDDVKANITDIERVKDQVQVLQKLRTMEADNHNKTNPNVQIADLANDEIHADIANIEGMKDKVQVLQKLKHMEADNEDATISNGQFAELDNDVMYSGAVNDTARTIDNNESKCIVNTVETTESSVSIQQANFSLNIPSWKTGHDTDAPLNLNNTDRNGFDDVDGYLASQMSLPSPDSYIKTTIASTEDVQIKTGALTIQTSIAEETLQIYSAKDTLFGNNTHSTNVSDKSDGSRVNDIEFHSLIKSTLEPEINNGACSPSLMHQTGADRTHHEGCDGVVQRVQSCNVMVCKSIAECPCPRPGKRLSTAFNYLSTLINQGDFIKFENISFRLQQRFHENYDMMCILGYLHASRDLFKTDFDSAKKHINDTMEIVPKTSNPRYFTLELFTAKTRMYVSQKKLEKMQNTLDEALMIFETDPVGLTGRAAGWLYINDARNKTAQLSCLNLSKLNALHVYNRLFGRAKSSFQRSMTNFLRDGGKDGPFGFGYALCRLVILLMRCGDNGLTMTETMLEPPADDLQLAGDHLQHLENSDIAIPKIMEMHLRLAKCDYHFRRKNTTRALEHAQIAYDIASDLSMLEFKEHAYNRLQLLRSRQTLQRMETEMSEEEVNLVLFGDSSSDMGDSC